ncbi:hypothetical protein Tco_0375413 [Tanacetum coccineum]
MIRRMLGRVARETQRHVAWELSFTSLGSVMIYVLLDTMFVEIAGCDTFEDEEEEEHLAPADPFDVPVVDLVPSAGDT